MPIIGFVSRRFIHVSVDIMTNMSSNTTRIVRPTRPIAGKNALTFATNFALRICSSLRPLPRHDRSEIEQILESEPRRLCRRGHDGIIGDQAGPSCRQRREVTMSRSVEHAIFAPVRAPDHHVNFLTTLRMERMRDPDRRGHVPGAGCSRYVR
jgi:hypothetical protein